MSMNENPPCTMQLSTATERPTTTGRRGTIPLLYDATDRMQAILAALDESDGELTDAVQSELAQLEGTIHDRVEAIVKAIREREALATVREAEAKGLSGLAETDRRTVRGLKQHLLENLNRTGLRKMETTLFKLSVCKNSRPSIKPLTEQIPKRYQRVEISFDWAKAWEDWKVGKLPDGFEVEVGQHVRIK